MNGVCWTVEDACIPTESEICWLLVQYTDIAYKYCSAIVVTIILALHANKHTPAMNIEVFPIRDTDEPLS